MQAVILCQFLLPIDFALIFKILQENAHQLDTTYFRFLWEMPIIEHLISLIFFNNFFLTAL
jgi:hypothetical protein